MYIFPRDLITHGHVYRKTAQRVSARFRRKAGATTTVHVLAQPHVSVKKIHQRQANTEKRREVLGIDSLDYAAVRVPLVLDISARFSAADLRG